MSLLQGIESIINPVRNSAAAAVINGFSNLKFEILKIFLNGLIKRHIWIMKLAAQSNQYEPKMKQLMNSSLKASLFLLHHHHVIIANSKVRITRKYIWIWHDVQQNAIR